MNNKKQLIWYSVSAAGIIITLAYLLFTVESADFLWDTYYVRYAANPFRGEVTPWIYRLLTPLLVYVLPLSIPTGFFAVNITSVAITAFLLVVVCRRIGVCCEIAILAIFPYLLSPGIEWQIREIWFNDAISHLCLVLAVLAMLQNQHHYVSLFSTIGIMNRTTSLYLLPVWYVFIHGWKLNKKSILHTLLVWGPAIVMLLLIQNVYSPLTSFNYIRSLPVDFNQVSFWVFYSNEYFKLNSSFQFLLQRMVSWELFNSYFGTLLPIYFLGLWKCASQYRILSIWLLIVWFQFVFAEDVGRLETYAFPIIIPFALLTIQHYIQPLQARYGFITLLGILLWIFPSNLLIGIIIMVVLIVIQHIYSQNYDEQENIFYNTTPQSKSKILGTVCIQLLVFSCFAFLCWKTFLFRPKLIASFPPQYVQQQFTLVFFKNDGFITNTFQVNEDSISSDLSLSLGGPNLGYNHIGVKMPYMYNKPITLQLLLWGTQKQGNKILMNSGTMQDNFIMANSYDFYPIIPGLTNPIIVEQYFELEPNSSLFCFYNLEQWQGQFQFILADASNLYSMKKSSK